MPLVRGIDHLPSTPMLFTIPVLAGGPRVHIVQRHQLPPVKIS